MSDLTFHPETPERVKRALTSHCGFRHLRIRIWYGDTKTGTAWMDENDVIGSVGKSTGTQPIPSLIANSRSLGGGAILDHCIVRIDGVNSGTLYRHPAFNNPADRATFHPSTMEGYECEVRIDGEVHARFHSWKSARNWVAFMQGKRYAK